jgi:hypothetical protein
MLAIIAAGPYLRIIMRAASPEPDAQEEGYEDHHDHGGKADHQQDHRTTQQAMAIWAALARPTRPWRAPSPCR